MRLPCITLKELPLHLILIKDKTMEVRGFRFKHGEVLGLHANAQCRFDLPGIEAGHIVAVARVGIPIELTKKEWEANRYRHRIKGRSKYKKAWGWPIIDVKPIVVPIKARGQLGVWYHDVELYDD